MTHRILQLNLGGDASVPLATSVGSSRKLESPVYKFLSVGHVKKNIGTKNEEDFRVSFLLLFQNLVFR